MFCLTAFADVDDTLLDALISVESSGNDRKIGDHGKSYGCLQIQQSYLDDANKFMGTSYTLKDMFDRETAKIVVRAYLRHYAGTDADYETYARIHNGGPRGHRKTCTEKYWKKVKAVLEK